MTVPTSTARVAGDDWWDDAAEATIFDVRAERALGRRLALAGRISVLEVDLIVIA